MTLWRLLAASALLSSLVSCGGGSTPTPPSFTSACEQNVCEFAYDTNGDNSYKWAINGKDVGIRNIPFPVLFQTNGTYTVTLTNSSNGLSSHQQVIISPLAVLQYEVQTSLQMVLMADRNAKLLRGFADQAVPLIEAKETANGQQKQDTVQCAGGGSFDYIVGATVADSRNLQPGDKFFLTPSGGPTASCALASGAPAFEGDPVEDIFAEVTYGTKASGIPLQFQLGIGEIGGQPWWSMEGMYFTFTPSGNTLDVATTPPVGNASGRWIYVPSNWVWDEYFDGGATYLAVSDFQMTTDANDTHSISAGMVWQPTLAGYEFIDSPVKITVNTPLDITSDAQGLHMTAGSMTVTNYATSAQLKANNPSSEVTISVPPGADPTLLQVTATDFSPGGTTIHGTYEQMGIVSYPHDCGTGESAAYCIESTFFYENMYVF